MEHIDMAQPSREYTRKPESTLIRERYERIKLAYQLKLKNNSFTPGEQNQMQADMQALAHQYQAAYQAEQGGQTPSKERIAHTIDTTQQPKLPSWGKIVEHDTSLGVIEWDKERFKEALYSSPKQLSGQVISGEDLRKVLKKQGIPVLNATVLDYLIEHPEEIPEEWEQDGDGFVLNITFWGTVIQHSNGNYFVRRLFRLPNGGGWEKRYTWIMDNWSGNDQVAAVFPDVTPQI